MTSPHEPEPELLPAEPEPEPLPAEPAPAEPERHYRLDVLAAALPIVEAPDFVAGQWHDSEKLANGSWTMPWYELSPAAEAFLSAVGGSGLLLHDFAWPAWTKTPDAQALHNERPVLAQATPDDLAKLLTALVRQDRFNEGALGDSFDSGIMTAIARRAKELAEV